MKLETKDLVTFVVSGAAFVVSLASFYFAQIHKPSGAMLILLERNFSAAVWKRGLGHEDYLPPTSTMVSPQIRHLRYSLSNTGKQTLYVKSVDLLRGADTRGNLRSHVPFTVIPSGDVDAFLIAPGDIKIIELDQPMDYEFPDDYDFVENCYELVSLEVVSADGHRYQMCHNITGLQSWGMDIHHPIWDGTTLGNPIRGTGFV